MGKAERVTGEKGQGDERESRRGEIIRRKKAKSGARKSAQIIKRKPVTASREHDRSS